MKHNPAKKLKLVCSFNGRFRYTGAKLRYTGGETRIISVDLSTLNYSTLLSTVSDLFLPGKTGDGFTLKYQLPWSEDDCPLVLVTSDDDVKCMVEEFECAAGVQSLHGKTSRLWLFVCTNGDDNDNDEKYDDGIVVNEDCDYGNVVNEKFRNLCERGEFGVLGRNSNNGFCNMVNKSGMNMRRVSDDSLRKMVLKQQMLARKKEEIQCIVNLGSDEQNYDHSLIDLGPEIESIDDASTLNYVNGRSFPCTTQLMRDQNLGGLAGSPDVRSSHLNPRDGKGKDRSLESSFGGCTDSGRNREVGFGQRLLSPYMNRESILPSYQDGNAPLSCGNHVLGSTSMQKSYHRGHGVFSINDGRNQRFGFSGDNGSHRNVRVDGKGSFAARCYPGLGASRTTISKQGQAMRLNHLNSTRPFSGLHENRVVETKRLINPNLKLNDQVSACTPQLHKENIKNQAQMYHGVGGQSLKVKEEYLIDFGNESGGVKHDVPYEQCAEKTIMCEPDFKDANMNVMHMVPQHVARLDGMLMHTAGGAEFSGDYHTGHAMPDGVASSIDISSYNPSLSSSKFAPPVPSHASSEVAEGLKMAHLYLFDQAVEAKALAETEESNSNVMHSVNGAVAKGLHDEMQSMNDEVDTRKIHKSFSILNGIPNDLQTIKDSELEYIKELGSGNYGIVYYGKWKGSDVVIKKIKPSCFNGDVKEDDRLVVDFWKEAHMLGQLHHPNIVALYGVVTDGPITNLATVTEYMINGSLKQVLQRKDRSIDRRKRLIIAMDAAFGMEYLHEKKIVHFDLKSHNFLVNMRDPQRPVCKIGDLGLSKQKQRTLVSGGVRGTIPWMAPELLSTTSNLVTEKVDVYSFGIVMWELLTGEEPYANMRSYEILAGILKGTLRPQIPSWCDPAWRSLMERCWSSDPKSRPSFSEVAQELRAMSAAVNI